MVTVLFPGGRGQLKLVEPDEDHPQGGVAVEVKPAKKLGKRLQLLSGGERALVAIAFLMALVLARPCPFYILDEIEAALDDVNIGRLVQLLRDYRERTQFVIITHQKRTMEAADVLYGVTMGQDGASQVVSARMAEEEIEREERARAEAAGRAGGLKRPAARAAVDGRLTGVEWHEVFKGVDEAEVPAAVLEEEAQERRGLFGRLRRNLGKARGAVADALKSAVYVGVDRRLYEQTEEMLIAADVGVDGTIKIVDELEQRCTAKKIETREPFQDELADVVAELLRPDDPERAAHRRLAASPP